ncbi:transposase [Streptomyces sp900116325]|uniref:transposase n=1 Tax=Streptomyces sp. 900116325 TaxID=3154295 RepID=UPI0033BE8392
MHRPRLLLRITSYPCSEQATGPEAPDCPCDQNPDSVAVHAQLPHPDRRALRSEGPHLIVDRRSAYRSKTVRAWPAGHKHEIELHFLPSYSPEPNPDELVNADLKRNLPRTHQARNQAELAAETRRFFHRQQRQPHVVTGYFKAPHVRHIHE